LISNDLAEVPSIFTYDLGNGQNFLTIVATNGESIASTMIDARADFTTCASREFPGPRQ
jgi:hypothetical protein